ncbi:uncharacterized protein LOC132062296 [Lycium ferocissimum]|uniref:uncharacterized protein LOC132062296 n=1 Tax=Lycium ferocissimum TaxID=112874 RepID=UPI0028149EDB|nr:uncharacterized protein LOC132062296 [Lycium ferocissimum]
MICELPNEGMITLTNEDAEGITLPHNDALVIIVLIDRCHVKRVMVNPGSSTNNIRWKVLEEMGLLEKIIPTARTLSGFNTSSETTKGDIDLPVKAGGVIKITKFYMIDGDMRYIAIYRRLWIHDMKVVPLILHLSLKFPTPEGIKKIREEQPTSKEMLAIEEPKEKKISRNRQIAIT